MKNFQVRHGQYDRIIFSETFSLGSSSNYPAILIWGLINTKVGMELFRISQKGRHSTSKRSWG